MRCSEPLRASRHLLPPPPFRPPCRCRAAYRSSLMCTNVRDYTGITMTGAVAEKAMQANASRFRQRICGAAWCRRPPDGFEKRCAFAVVGHRIGERGELAAMKFVYSRIEDCGLKFAYWNSAR